MEDNTKTQNRRFLNRILENPKSQMCVGNTKYWKKPPTGYTKGYYKYCVRKTNKAGWYSITQYLKRKGVSTSKLPMTLARKKSERCIRLQKCKKNTPNIDDTTQLEHAVLVLKNHPNGLSAREIHRRARLPGNAKSMVAILRGNAENKGKQIFKTNRKVGEIAKWKLKPNVAKKIKNKSNRNIIQYIREKV
jgi:hypothetical protein